MSRFGKLLIAALLFTGFSTFAQTSDQPASAPPGAKPNHMRGDRAEQKLKRLSKRLNLTDDQKEKLRPVLQDEEQQLKSVEDDNSMTSQQKHRKMREIRMSVRSQMDAILTPEQKDKLQSERPRTGGRHRRRLGAANSDPGDPI
jgi:periplasmic protein CpxP/Spy